MTDDIDVDDIKFSRLRLLEEVAEFFTTGELKYLVDNKRGIRGNIQLQEQLKDRPPINQGTDLL